MATNDFLVVAPGPTPNVASQATYAADPIVTTGNVSGVAKSAIVNKALRQSSIMASVLGQIIAARTGQNVVDDGTTSTILTNLTAAISQGTLVGVQVLTALSGTYTKNPLAISGLVEVQGGGGGGGGAGATTAGSAAAGNGGGAGGYVLHRFATLPATQAYAVGNGGAGGSSNGSGGGTTTFGSLSATGGGGGGLVSVNTFPATLNSASQGAGSGGNIINAKGSQGTPLLLMQSNNALSGGGGSSKFGGGANQVAVNTTGASATTPGTGGGGACTSNGGAQAGGSGANGIIIVWEYA